MHRRETEDDAENGGHDPVTQKGLLGKEKVLQLSALDCHENRSMRRIEGGNDPLFPLDQRKGFASGLVHTDTTTEAALIVNRHHLRCFPGVFVLCDRIDGADPHTATAAGTAVGVDPRKEVGRVNGMKMTEAAHGEKSFATASTAVTDEGDTLTHVFSELDQTTVTTLLKNIQRLCRRDPSRHTVVDQRARRISQRQADIQRCIARLVDMKHLMAAIADTQSPVGSLLDD